MELQHQSPACARDEEHTVILWITVPFDCTGGAPPLVARVHAPVCPSLATPLVCIVQYPVEGCDNVNMGAFSW